MPTPLSQKSTTDDIRERFDADVERFSNLETGQVATIDAPLAMELITQAAIASTLSRQRTTPVTCSTKSCRISAASRIAAARTLAIRGTAGVPISTSDRACAMVRAAGCIRAQ